MSYSQLIKRAFEITRRYKALWIFGILLALTSGSGGGSGWSGGRGNGRDTQFPGFPSQLPGLDRLGLDRINWPAITGVIVACCCVLFILAIISVFVNYVARAALYRSVDQIEATGAAPTWREGFRLGWSNRSFRLWLLDLVVAIPFAIIALLLLGLGATPLLLLLVDSPAAKWLAVVATIGLEFFVIVALVIAGVLVGIFGQFWSREIALADRGIGDALRTGYAAARSRLKEASVMWLALFGIGLGFGIVFLALFVIVLIIAAAVGGGIGLLVHTLTQSVGWAVALGLPFFLVILLVPATFIQGLWMTFESAAWTLTYREIEVAKG
ncbi:MAG: hypothetical protein QG637_1821 [Chloroflexota bacterium]|nr:hypothetical protein [Chloroflexota bacterium]